MKKELEFEKKKLELVKDFEDYKHNLVLERIRIEMAERKKLENLKFRLKEEYFKMSRGRR